jgi:hypothetical protein
MGNSKTRAVAALIGWNAAFERGATRMTDQPDDVFLSPREGGQNREAGMREYLTWEINLVNDMAKDDDHRFRITT